METPKADENAVHSQQQMPQRTQSSVTIGAKTLQSNPFSQNQSPSNNTPIIGTTVAPTPVRSVSTLNFNELRETISPAAPFPSLPTKQEVINCKAEVDETIEMLKTKLASLQYERKTLEAHNKRSPSIVPEGSADSGIHVFKGLIMTDNVINDVIKDNMKKAQKAQTRALVDPCEDAGDKCSALHKLPKYRHIVDLPQYTKTIDKNKELLTPLYAAKVGEKEVIMEKEDELAAEYNELSEPWKRNQEIIDEYNDRTSEKNENWPPEFKFDHINFDEATLMKWAAQDTPMILSKQQQIDRCYYDTNSLVEDPVTEFSNYKKRLVWTEDEKRIFLDRYSQHPKDFAFVASALPDKSMKEVIEFYYLTRYKLNLKESEGAVRKRGGKKKVVSEGSKKKF